MPSSGRFPERSALAPGVRLGPYEVLAALGSGGMGEVYRARDVIRVALADRRAERVLEVAELGPTVEDFNFDGLASDGSVLLVTIRYNSDIPALEWRAP